MGPFDLLYIIGIGEKLVSWLECGSEGSIQKPVGQFRKGWNRVVLVSMAYKGQSSNAESDVSLSLAFEVAQKEVCIGQYDRKQRPVGPCWYGVSVNIAG